MYLVRDVFRAKPGRAKNLVSSFKQAVPFMEAEGFSNIKLMTDVVANYWTVVLQAEVESLDHFEKHSKGFTSKPQVAEIMKGYMDNIEGGHREIFKLE
ncbi:MAG: antibiotic biosynthesis monooxygenase [Ignavibacteriales bacterium]|nr:antibiotic biosynthesis monooxygenase [Ignavibacteriales bacterium]